MHQLIGLIYRRSKVRNDGTGILLSCCLVLGVGREDRRKIEKILAEVFPNLVKTTKSGNPKNVKQKKGEENHTTELNCSKPVITR